MLRVSSYGQIDELLVLDGPGWMLAAQSPTVSAAACQARTGSALLAAAGCRLVASLAPLEPPGGHSARVRRLGTSRRTLRLCACSESWPKLCAQWHRRTQALSQASD